MVKTSHTTYIELQRKKSSVALIIRLIVFVGVTIFFFGHYHFNVTHKGDGDLYQESQNKHGRQLLSVINSEFKNSFEVPLSELSLSKNVNKSIDVLAFNETNFSEQQVINCTPSAILELHGDGFNRIERKQGWIILHIILACYCFWLLAAICDDYFVPSIELICNGLKLNEDVIGATVLAAATSSPELFINCIGTFVTKGDIGIGAIVGSAVFNVLAVPACCGLFANQFVVLDWWPVTRDCLIYCFAVLGLIATLYDGKVMWFEALLLVLAYFVYIIAMYYSADMVRQTRILISKYRSRKIKKNEFTESTRLLSSITKSKLNIAFIESETQGAVLRTNTILSNQGDSKAIESDIRNTNTSDFADNPWEINNRNILIYILRWPITFLLWGTIPDCRKHLKTKYLTFSLAVIWIAIVSYLVAFFIVIVGDTLNIPDSVMGLTILAAGMSIPEAVSSVIVTNKGHGGMGISNSIGSNTFDILLCLGLPWFIKAFFVPSNVNEYWVTVNSSGLTYSAVFLLITLLGLYLAFLANKFILDWKIGVSCIIMYIVFLVLGSMIQLNFFSNVNLPMCDS